MAQSSTFVFPRARTWSISTASTAESFYSLSAPTSRESLAQALPALCKHSGIISERCPPMAATKDVQIQLTAVEISPPDETYRCGPRQGGSASHEPEQPPAPQPPTSTDIPYLSTRILERPALSKQFSRRSSRHQTSYTTLHGSSRHSSRRSSFAPGSGPASLGAGRPRPSHRPGSMSSAASSPTEVPYLAHARALSLVQSLTSPSPSTPADDSDAEIGENRYVAAPPPTTIDWTDPASRRRELERLERARKGWRGMWRKMVPGCCRDRSRGGERGAPDGHDCDDRGSVRKYRLDFAGKKGVGESANTPAEKSQNGVQHKQAPNADCSGKTKPG